MKVDKYIINWLNISLIAVFLMILIGGITRLTDSGLSITTWKPVTGILPPLNQHEWEISFNNYKEIAEYKVYNSQMSLKEYKSIYFWEYVHRMLGRIIGLLFFFPFVYFYKKKYFNKEYLMKFLFLFFIGLLQGFMGWYMVQSGLSDLPDISHLRLSVHLLLALIIIGYIYWIKLSLLRLQYNKVNNFIFYNKFINLILFVLVVQIIYGAFTAGLKAGQFWNTYPIINGVVFPESVFSLKPFWKNFLYHNETIQIIHRNLPIVITILMIVFSYKINRESLNNTLYSNIIIMNLFLFFQFILGILTLITKVSIVLAISHQFLAIVLFVSILKTKHSLRFR